MLKITHQSLSSHVNEDKVTFSQLSIYKLKLKVIFLFNIFILIVLHIKILWKNFAYKSKEKCNLPIHPHRIQIILCPIFELLTWTISKKKSVCLFWVKGHLRLLNRAHTVNKHNTWSTLWNVFVRTVFVLEANNLLSQHISAGTLQWEES